jgi:hypothetical protein
MYTKLAAIVLVAALAAVLITSTIAAADDADARQRIKQSNKNCGNCANAASQVDGNGNSVSISISQSK